MTRYNKTTATPEETDAHIEAAFRVCRGIAQRRYGGRPDVEDLVSHAVVSLIDRLKNGNLDCIHHKMVLRALGDAYKWHRRCDVPGRKSFIDDVPDEELPKGDEQVVADSSMAVPWDLLEGVDYWKEYAPRNRMQEGLVAWAAMYPGRKTSRTALCKIFGIDNSGLWRAVNTAVEARRIWVQQVGRTCWLYPIH